MDDFLTTALLFRGLERLICAFGAFFTVLLGAYLFKWGTYDNFSFEAWKESAGYKIRSTAPGTIFGIVGIILACMVVNSTLKLGYSDLLEQVAEDDNMHVPTEMQQGSGTSTGRDLMPPGKNSRELNLLQWVGESIGPLEKLALDSKQYVEEDEDTINKFGERIKLALAHLEAEREWTSLTSRLAESLGREELTTILEQYRTQLANFFDDERVMTWKNEPVNSPGGNERVRNVGSALEFIVIPALKDIQVALKKETEEGSER